MGSRFHTFTSVKINQHHGRRKRRRRRPHSTSMRLSPMEQLPVNPPPASRKRNLYLPKTSKFLSRLDKQDGEDGGDDTEDIDLDFSKGMKKKKKKKVTGIVVEEEKEEKEGVEEPEDIDLDFSKSMKKKKKKKIAGVGAGEDDKEDGNEENAGVAWATEGDYTYDELLNRVFNIMRENNPEMVAGEKKKFTMRPPQVVRIGTKKTSFANFSEICKMLHRQPKHLLAFLLAELGT